MLETCYLLSFGKSNRLLLTFYDIIGFWKERSLNTKRTIALKFFRQLLVLNRCSASPPLSLVLWLHFLSILVHSLFVFIYLKSGGSIFPQYFAMPEKYVGNMLRSSMKVVEGLRNGIKNVRSCFHVFLKFSVLSNSGGKSIKRRQILQG